MLPAAQRTKVAAHIHPTIRQWRKNSDRTIRPQTSQKRLIARTVGIEAGNAADRRSIDLRKGPADPHASRGINVQCLNRGIGSRAYIKTGSERAGGGEFNNPRSRLSGESRETAGGEDPIRTNCEGKHRIVGSRRNHKT
ncbi:MAG: hypothetical protein SynsKO_05780 [Synoicihabitans sp.]